MTKRETFDVAIAGGGPAGAATAIRLARGGLGVVLADGDDRRDDKVGETLAPSARPVLERVGVWDQFKTAGHRPSYANRSSWGSGEVDTHDFVRDPNGHGWHIDRRAFEAMLAGQAMAAGCRMLPRTRVWTLGRCRDGWCLTIRGDAESEIFARFVVDATGRTGHLARSLGARREFHDRSVALVAFVGPGEGLAPVGGALVEAVQDGWWYTAPLPDRRMVSAFVTDADLLRRSGGRSAAAWATRLARTVHTRARLSRAGSLVASPFVVAAGSGVLDQAAGPGWVAVGDAAAAYDPLTSHGIGAALAGGWEAAAVTMAALDGDPAACPAYAQRVRRAFGAYLQQRGAYYAMEERWPDSPFWRRRVNGRSRAPSGTVGSVL